MAPLFLLIFLINKLYFIVGDTDDLDKKPYFIYLANFNYTYEQSYIILK